jgi:hypothetical protein
VIFSLWLFGTGLAGWLAGWLVDRWLAGPTLPVKIFWLTERAY